MATGTKICKICGKEYPYCKTVFKPGVFRWSDVACCEEHGKEYLAKIIASRSEANKDNDAVAVVDDKVSGSDELHKDVEVKPVAKKTRRKKVEAEEPAIEE